MKPTVIIKNLIKENIKWLKLNFTTKTDNNKIKIHKIVDINSPIFGFTSFHGNSSLSGSFKCGNRESRSLSFSSYKVTNYYHNISVTVYK